MKKFFLFLMLIAFISCEGDVGPMGPVGYDGETGKNGKDGKDGEDGKDGYGTNWNTQSFSIKEADWVLVGQSSSIDSYYYADVKIPELSQFVFDEGTVIGYISFENVKNGLPFVQHTGSDVGGVKELWTQTYDFEFKPGSIRFIVTYSDFKTQMSPASEMFHIVIMW